MPAGSFLVENVTFREPSGALEPDSAWWLEGSRNVTFPKRNEPADTAGHPPSVFGHLSNVSGHLRSPRRPGRNALIY